MVTPWPWEAQENFELVQSLNHPEVEPEYIVAEKKVDHDRMMRLLRLWRESRRPKNKRAYFSDMRRRWLHTDTGTQLRR